MQSSNTLNKGECKKNKKWVSVEEIKQKGVELRFNQMNTQYLYSSDAVRSLYCVPTAEPPQPHTFIVLMLYVLIPL